MFAFFVADFNLIYSLTLALVLGLAVIEGIGLLLGLSLANLLDDILPLDLDLDIEVPSGGVTAILGWLYLNRLPFLIWLVLLLSSFGIFGLSLNYITPQPLLTSLPITLVAALFITRYLSKIIVKIIPKNESSALSVTSFSGKVATITIGRASKGNAAEAVFHDEFKQKHYVLVEPEADDEIFEQGCKVLLIEKQAKSWLAIKYPH